MPADSRKTKAELIEELKSLRSCVAAFEQTDRGAQVLQRSDVLQALCEVVPVGLCCLDKRLRFVFINKWLADINGLPVERHVGRRIGEVIPDVAMEIESQLHRVIETGEPLIEGTVVAETPADPEARRHFRHSYLPIKSSDGTVVGVSCFVQEVTERMKAEEALVAKAETEQLLLRELNHRVRNHVASLIALIDLTCSGAKDVTTLAESIKGRVNAIATAHSELSRTQWHVVELRTLLQTLVDDGLEGHIELDGPPVTVPPEQAQALALVVHELTTNSRKFGALSNLTGSVSIIWETHRSERDAVRLIIHWRETGGPSIDAEPKPGTGTELIRGLVQSELRGQVDFRYPSQGADHTIAITLSETEREPLPVVADSA